MMRRRGSKSSEVPDRLLPFSFEKCMRPPGKLNAMLPRTQYSVFVASSEWIAFAIYVEGWRDSHSGTKTKEEGNRHRVLIVVGPSEFRRSSCRLHPAGACGGWIDEGSSWRAGTKQWDVFLARVFPYDKCWILLLSNLPLHSTTLRRTWDTFIYLFLKKNLQELAFISL